jgi:hypothetical protein
MCRDMYVNVHMFILMNIHICVYVCIQTSIDKFMIRIHVKRILLHVYFSDK